LISVRRSLGHIEGRQFLLFGDGAYLQIDIQIATFKNREAPRMPMKEGRKHAGGYGVSSRLQKNKGTVSKRTEAGKFPTE
jgi:hypothetical protein